MRFPRCMFAFVFAAVSPSLSSAMAQPADVGSPSADQPAGAASPAIAQPTDAASWLRTRVSNALNPKISLIGDFVYQTGPGRTTDRFSLRETELALQSEVDPYTRADFFFALHEGEGVELEEGYITLLALPLGLQGRGGKFFANFGRLNMVHTHELPQVDRPLALTSYLGEHGINDTGVELSRIFTPFGLFTEATYGFINGLGESHSHDEETAQVLTVDGSTVTVTTHNDEANLPRTARNFAHVARVRFNGDLTDSQNLELGFSGALHQPDGGEDRRLGGVDLTYRWRPLREGLYRSFLWRTEVLYSKRPVEAHEHAGAEEEAEEAGEEESHDEKVERYGGYSYVEIQPARRWRFGVRGDYYEDPTSEAFHLTKAVTPYVTFAATEFNRYRVQYQYRDLPDNRHEHVGWVQWTVVLGPHGAHPF